VCLTGSQGFDLVNGTQQPTVLNYTRFAVSTPVSMRLRLQFINFWRLSDRNMTFTSPLLTGAQLAGRELVSFTVSVPAQGVAPQFYAGGRLYGETGACSCAASRCGGGAERLRRRQCL
jgi:hypothetical protein